MSRLLKLANSHPHAANIMLVCDSLTKKIFMDDLGKMKKYHPGNREVFVEYSSNDADSYIRVISTGGLMLLGHHSIFVEA